MTSVMTSTYLSADHFLQMDHTRYSKSPALQNRRSKGYGMISTDSASESESDMNDFTDNNNNNNNKNNQNNNMNNNNSNSTSNGNLTRNSSIDKNSRSKVIPIKNESDLHQRVKSHSFGEKTPPKSRQNQVVFGGSLKDNSKRHPFMKDVQKSPTNGFVHPQVENHKHEKPSKGRKYSHGTFSTIKEVNQGNNDKHAKPEKGRKHSLGNFKTTKVSFEPGSPEKNEKPDKARKNSLSAVDQVKRKFSTGKLFTRKKSTATSPESHRKQSLRSASLVTTSPDTSNPRKHLKSPSSPLVSSPDLCRKNHAPHPLKSSSSSAMSPRQDDLRRFAMNHRSQNHEESHRRSADSTPFNNTRTRRKNVGEEAQRRSADSAYQSNNHYNKACPSSTLLPHKERSERTFESCSNPDIVSTSPYGGKMKEYNVYCLGSKQTGKTALAVRYLTGRYIHEYTSLDDEIYTRVVKYGGERINVTITIFDADKIEQDIEMDSKSGVMIIFSVTDKSSLKGAEDLLKHLKALKLSNTIPVVLVASKTDLEHYRRITEEECSDLADRYNCTLFEVSAARDGNVQLCFQQLFKQIEIRQILRGGDDDDGGGGMGSVLTAKRLSMQDYRDSFSYSTIDSESDVSNDAEVL